MIPFLPQLIGLGASAIGGLIKKKQKTSSAIDPAMAPLQQMLLSHFTSRLKSPSALPSGYEARGISDINRTYDLVGKHLDNTLTARGLGTSPVAGAGETKLQSDRAGEITRFQQGLPMIEQQMRMEDLLNAMNLMNMGGQTSTSTSGGGWGGAFGDFGSMLGWMMGQGMFGGKNKMPQFGTMYPKPVY